jgi:CBS domain-containing protein
MEIVETPEEHGGVRRGGTVADAMHHGVITCLPSAPLRGIARTMTRAGIHAVVVWGDEEDDSEGIWGIVSNLDLVASAARGDDVARSAVGAARTEIVTVRATESLARAAELMTLHQVSHLIVIAADERPIGVLSTSDLAGVLAERGSLAD